MKLKQIKVTVNGKPAVFWNTPVTFNDIIDQAGIEMGEEWRLTEGERTIPIADGYCIDVDKKEIAQ